MKNWKNKVLAMVLMLVMALVLAACGSDDASPEGTYTAEGTGITITFTDDTFRVTMPYEEMLGYDIDGDFAFSGRFTVNNSDRLVEMSVSANNLRGPLQDMIDELLEWYFANDPDLSVIMTDPDFADIAEEVREAMDVEMAVLLESMLDELVDEFEGMSLRFERGNFDRLYDDEDDTVFIRQ